MVFAGHGVVAATGSREVQPCTSISTRKPSVPTRTGPTTKRRRSALNRLESVDNKTSPCISPLHKLIVTDSAMSPGYSSPGSYLILSPLLPRLIRYAQPQRPQGVAIRVLVTVVKRESAGVLGTDENLR